MLRAYYCSTSSKRVVVFLISTALIAAVMFLILMENLEVIFYIS